MHPTSVFMLSVLSLSTATVVSEPSPTLRIRSIAFQTGLPNLEVRNREVALFLQDGKQIRTGCNATLRLTYHGTFPNTFTIGGTCKPIPVGPLYDISEFVGSDASYTYIGTINNHPTHGTVKATLNTFTPLPLVDDMQLRPFDKSSSVLSWSKVNGAKAYEVQRCSVDLKSCGGISQGWTINTYINIPYFALDEQTYRLKVIAYSFLPLEQDMTALGDRDLRGSSTFSILLKSTSIKGRNLGSIVCGPQCTADTTK